MLTPVITFEVRNFTTGSFEEFIIPATEENYSLIAGNRFTRAIHFGQQFDFQKVHAPSFILETLVVGYLSDHERELEIDDVDEMTGILV